MQDASVFNQGKIRAKRQFLKNAAKAVSLRFERAPSAHGAAAEPEVAGGALNDARQHIHQRRLAGAIVPHKSNHFSGRDAEIDAAQRPNRAIGLLYPGHFEKSARDLLRAVRAGSRRARCHIRLLAYLGAGTSGSGAFLAFASMISATRS